MTGPVLAIHGGAGEALRRDPSDAHRARLRDAIAGILEVVYSALRGGVGALEAVVAACERLEDCEHFNAGTGSVLQFDGEVRLSAGLMDGARHAFSGVVNATDVQHPVRMAACLQDTPDRVLSESGLGVLARQMRLVRHDPRTDARVQEWRRGAEPPPGAGMGTVGAVALDRRGHLAAATSTGGRGLAFPGRVSDSCTPCGNYATDRVAVSCTGRGEDILDEGLAVKVAARVADGMTLDAALARCFDEARARDRSLAAIALSASGQVGWDTTTGALVAGAANEQTVELFF